MGVQNNKSVCFFKWCIPYNTPHKQLQSITDAETIYGYYDRYLTIDGVLPTALQPEEQLTIQNKIFYHYGEEPQRDVKHSFPFDPCDITSLFVAKKVSKILCI